jgi:integrase
MTMAKRGYGDGGIDERGENTFRLRYRVDGKRFTKTFSGTATEARKELRKLVRSGDTGEHIEPSKITVGQWLEQWIEAGAPGRRKKKVGQRTLERYEELLNVHVKPAIGPRPLQQLKAPEIDSLYAGLEGKIAPRTARHVHVVLGAALATAERKGMIAVNPMARVEQIPNPDRLPVGEPDANDSDYGNGLDEVDLAALVGGFKPSGLYPVVALAAASGARRNELLALRWSDLDREKRTLRIERAWEPTKKYGLRLKPPKTARGLRTISLDEVTVSMLVDQCERHLRIHAGIPDGADVDLSLIRLPAGALMFPAVPERGEFDFTAPRNPRNFSKEFARRAGKLGFGSTRFHDLRGIHATALLDAGIPVHTVAQRIGDDPAILLRNYAKRTRTKAADANLSDAIGKFASGFLGK